MAMSSFAWSISFLSKWRILDENFHSISNLELYLNQWNWIIQNENSHIGNNDGDDDDLRGQVHGGKPHFRRQLGVHCEILLFVTQWKVWIRYWVSWGDFDKILLKRPWIINLQEYATQNFDLYYDTKTQWPLVYGDDSNLTSCRDKESVLQVSFLKLSWNISNFSLKVENNQFINLTHEAHYSGCRRHFVSFDNSSVIR